MTPEDVHHHEMFDGDPQLVPFVRDLRQAAASVAPPEVGAELAVFLADGAVPAPMPPPRRRRRALVRGGIAAVAAAFGFGGLGVAGALPDPVQRHVARFADVVGVDVPDPAAEVVPAHVPPTPLPASVPTVPLTRQQSPGTGDDDRPDQGHRPGGDDVGDEPGRSEDSEDKGDDRGQSNEVPAIERDGRVRTEGGDADETEDDAGDDAEGSSGIRGSDRSDSKTRQRGAPRVFSHAS